MIEKIFPAEETSLKMALQFVETELEKVDCPMKTAMQLTIAIEEIFVNVVRYAYPDGKGEVKLGVAFDREENRVTFCMRDHGIPFNPLARSDPDITLSADERGIGGLGIYMMKKTMDEVYYVYENEENILTMIKKI